MGAATSDRRGSLGLCAFYGGLLRQAGRQATEVSAVLISPDAPTRAGTITNLGIRQQALWEYVHWLERAEAPTPELAVLVKKLADNAAAQAIGIHGVRIALANGWDDKVYAVEGLLREAKLANVHLVDYEIQLRLKLGVPIPMLPDA